MSTLIPPPLSSAGNHSKRRKLLQLVKLPPLLVADRGHGHGLGVVDAFKRGPGLDLECR
ncbi:hypothetical protein QJS04_geneDACA022274 [Acorus gramineus]|uniref:Uncharacterized protein n=1 Tax=Acorus gramineus TaxID=55184 RepID=A0AAV9B8C2_ACOGR|nr:hypothetical protein QJS04_geneDACA022274 [Acorus gramineus]